MLCRICLTNSSSLQSLRAIVCSEGIHEMNGYEVMDYCLGIKIDITSEEIMQICILCNVKLAQYCQFKHLALKSHKYLTNCKRKPEEIGKAVNEDVKIPEILNTQNLIEDKKNVKLEFEVKDELSEKDIEEIYLNNTYFNKTKPVVQSSVATDASPLRKKRKLKVENPKKLALNNTPDSSVKSKICKICGKSFQRLQDHLPTHLPAEKRNALQCLLCEKSFLTQKGLREHVRIDHVGQLRSCKECGKVVPNLRSHKLSHHTARQYECDICNNRFSIKYILSRHIQSHSSENAACSMCQRVFKTRTNMLHHKRRVHYKTKDNLCQYCSSSFYTRKELTQHIRTHTGERPYACRMCNKTFVQSAARSVHERRMHAGERDHRCSVCNKAFFSRYSVQAHMIKHTKEKPFPCQYCTISFGRKDHRAVHEKNVHLKKGNFTFL